jgi:hypothetical protein
MPSLQLLNPGQSRSIDAPVRSIEVHTGSLVVTPPDYAGAVPSPVGEGEIYKANDTASLNLLSPTGSRFGVTYSDEPVVEVPKPKTTKKGRKKASK